MVSDIRCRNCGDPIRYINYSFQPRWVHQHLGASFEDGIYEYCQKSVATPPDNSQIPSPQPHPLRREVSPPGPRRDGDASGPGGVSNVP